MTLSDDTLDYQEQVARIKRAQAETDKLAEESRKFVTEQHIVIAEQLKLEAEAAKLRRDRVLSPWLAAVLALGSAGGVAAGALAVLRAFRLVD